MGFPANSPMCFAPSTSRYIKKSISNLTPQDSPVPENEVLIIGAGPSGLFAAAEFARHGVQARLVERDLQPHREARATSIQPGTLEILNTIGLLQPFLDTAER